MIPDFITEAMAPGRWPVFVLIATRLGGLMLTAPLWSMTTLPRTSRAVITVILTVLLLPSAPSTPVPEQILDLPLPIAMEMVIGLAIGLTAAVLVQGAAMAGEIIGVQSGLTIGAALLPDPDMQGSALSQLHSSLAVLVYIAVGGHTMMLSALAKSLEMLPPGMSMSIDRGALATTGLLSGLFMTAVRTAAPIMVTLLLVNIAFAILNRAVPQLNAMVLAFPVTIAISLIMVGITIEITADAMAGWVQGLNGTINGVLSSFHPYGAY